MSTESKGKQEDISSLSERKTDRQSPSETDNPPPIREQRPTIKGGKDRQFPPDKGGKDRPPPIREAKTDNPPLIRGARGVIYPTTYNGPIECQLLKYELF